MNFGKIIKLLKVWHRRGIIKKVEMQDILRGKEVVGYKVIFTVEKKQ